MKTPEELKAELQLKESSEEAVKVIEVNWPDDIDPAYLINHPLEAIVVDEQSGYVARRKLGAGWRVTL